MKGGRTIFEHLSDFQDIVNQLPTLEVVFGEELHALFLLSSLSDSWKSLIATVSNLAPGGKLPLNTIKDCLFNGEACVKEMGANINLTLVT